jgi:PAS domain S-box-containing protein
MDDAITDGDLRREARRMRHLVDAAPDALFVVTADGRIEFANSRAAVLFGRPVDDLVGVDIAVLVPDHQFIVDRGSHDEVRATHATACRADGSEFPADVFVSPLSLDADDAVICGVRDVTERIEAERALVRSEELLHEGERRVAVARARERIGMDLHDGVIQSLYSIGMQLAAAERATDDPVQRGRFTGAIDAIDEVISEIRNYIHGLRAAPTDEHGLVPALYDLAAEFEAATGVTVRVDVEEAAAQRLADLCDDCIQVVRELLSNVARHARASSARLALARAGGGVVLEVADDGVGFDPDDPHDGMGADNVRRRVRSAGGVVDVESAPGAGTTVRIRFAEAARRPGS